MKQQIRDFIELIKTTDDETSLREAVTPTPENMKELTLLIREICAEGACFANGRQIHLHAIAAEAVFNYLANEFGSSGYSAGYAGMIFIARTKGIDSPFRLVNLENWLYPQYDGHVEDWVKDNCEWLRAAAQSKLDSVKDAHPNVLARWRQLAA